MTSIVTPECDYADKLDLMKKGCGARSQFLIYIYDQKDTARKPFGKAGFLACRHHAREMHQMVMGFAAALLKAQSPAEVVTIKGVPHTFDNRIKLGIRIVDVTKHPRELRKYLAHVEGAQDAVRARLS